MEERIEEIENNLSQFLETNSHARIDVHEDTPCIAKPWNDESLVINIPEGMEETAAELLNTVKLPTRFSGIYHTEAGVMEFIFVPIDEEDDLFQRYFELNFAGEKFQCSFDEASPQLRYISSMSGLTGVETGTNYRNLSSLKYYFNVLIKEAMEEEIEEEEQQYRELIPTSFFIRGFENFDTDEVINLSKHLNFMMPYYDRNSPIIEIHPEDRTEETPFGQLELIKNKFPENLQSNKKDSILLELVLTANQQRESRLTFLYYYQVLEYASFYYLDQDIKFEVEKILNNPDLRANLGEYTGQILDILSEDQRDNAAKIVNVVNNVCNPKSIWEEIDENKQFFSHEMEFEGGFKLGKLISESTSYKEFEAMWTPKLPHTIRKIRNALVHGRESRQGFHIVPSKSNDLKLQPYINIIRRIAEEIVIHF